MAVKIATAPTFEAAADLALMVWEMTGKPKLIRLEGFDGAGKSGLAKIIALRIGAEHVEVDKFTDKPEVETPYRDCVRQSELDLAIGASVASGRTVILDGVCLDEVAPTARWGRGFVIYIKRLSFNNRDPMWHEGYWLESDDRTGEPHRSIFEYHKRLKPHEWADLIIELPENGHSISSFGFDRSGCFDPAGAEVIPYKKETAR